MKLTTRTQEATDVNKRSFVALDIVVSHNGKAVIWRWNNPKDAALVHTIVEKMNKMVDVLKKDNSELVDKEPKKISKKATKIVTTTRPEIAQKVIIQTDVPKAIKAPGSTRLD